MVPFAKAKEPVPRIEPTPGPLFFVLHDVSANTYSRTLIPNTNIQNLHHLFQVRPRWYNRIKATCDRIGVMMIRFKHAKPLVQMVALPQTTRPVRRAVKCFDAETLSGGEGNTLPTVGEGITLATGGESNTLGTIARGVGRVAAKATTGLSTALVVSTVAAGAAALHLNQTKQQELNNTCLTALKIRLANQNFDSGDKVQQIRIGCSGQSGNDELKKDIAIGNGVFGIVWSVKNNDTVVIKEQTALCYTFINEIECLTKLKDTGIVPLLKDAYICDTKPGKALENFKNSEITYGYVMEKLDNTLEAYISSLSSDSFQNEKKAIAEEILKILSTLTTNNIQHRDLHLGNLMVKLNVANRATYDKIYVIDFGQAEYNKTTKPLYSNLVRPPVAIGNIFKFVEQNTTQIQIKNIKGMFLRGNRHMELINTFIGLIDEIVQHDVSSKQPIDLNTSKKN